MNTISTEKKEKCCGCSVCENACPVSAITMKYDESGANYPVIDHNKCIECGKCVRVCPMQNKIEHAEPQNVYAAVTSNSDPFLSTSGGIFASLATSVLADGGYVVGASMNITKDGRVAIQHKVISDITELYSLLGSKYVQSNMGGVYKEIKSLLMSGQKVLFSGTPCQVNAVNNYLSKDYENFITVDIICHGVPGQKYFADYFEYISRKLRTVIKNIKFRDKRAGWDLQGSIVLGKSKIKLPFKVNASSYYSHFLKMLNYRESCYQCPYANCRRPSDITIGDYWGIQKYDPEFLQNRGGPFDASHGISCVMINTNKGKRIFEEYKAGFEYRQTALEKIKIENGQLSAPSKLSSEREAIMRTYALSGYAGVEKYFRRKSGVRYYARIIKCILQARKE